MLRRGPHPSGFRYGRQRVLSSAGMPGAHGKGGLPEEAAPYRRDS